MYNVFHRVFVMYATPFHQFSTMQQSENSRANRLSIATLTLCSDPLSCLSLLPLHNSKSIPSPLPPLKRLPLLCPLSLLSYLSLEILHRPYRTLTTP
jgi:hypothetical protein